PDLPHPKAVLRQALLAFALALLAAAAVSAAKPNAEHFSPDVLVLVLSGIGPFDQVSINYATEIPKKQALKDIDALVRETAWLVRDARVTTASSHTPGGRPTTSSVFRTPPLASTTDGTLPLEPFVSALRRFRSLEVNYLVCSKFTFRGLKEFENKWVKINLKRSGNSYLYRVRVKDSSFRRLGLPLVQPKPPARRSHGLAAGARVAVGVGLAAAASAIVYLAASRLSRHSKER
ncbi:MAG: hypothetical protein ACP5R5_05370, partial [Armatimonadota bacterium]